MTLQQSLFIICPLIFAAGFVDSIAGGGGLISLPAYIFTGMPAHFAYGTNKFSSTLGTFFAALRYMRNGQVHLKSAAASAACAVVGSYLGAKGALALDDRYLRLFLVAALPFIAAFILTRKGFGETDRTAGLGTVKMIVLSAVSGLLIGAYDGFFGPGTGTFLILAYTGIIGFDLRTASGNTKIVNLASNIAALVTFAAGGKVMLQVGIPAAVCGILGNIIGSGLAVKNGAKIIRPVFICVILLLFLKIGYDLLGEL